MANPPQRHRRTRGDGETITLGARWIKLAKCRCSELRIGLNYCKKVINHAYVYVFNILNVWKRNSASLAGITPEIQAYIDSLVENTSHADMWKQFRRAQDKRIFLRV